MASKTFRGLGTTPASVQFLPIPPDLPADLQTCRGGPCPRAFAQAPAFVPNTDIHLAPTFTSSGHCQKKSIPLSRPFPIFNIATHKLSLFPSPACRTCHQLTHSTCVCYLCPAPTLPYKLQFCPWFLAESTESCPWFLAVCPVPRTVPGPC